MKAEYLEMVNAQAEALTAATGLEWTHDDAGGLELLAIVHEFAGLLRDHFAEVAL